MLKRFITILDGAGRQG